MDGAFEGPRTFAAHQMSGRNFAKALPSQKHTHTLLLHLEYHCARCLTSNTRQRRALSPNAQTACARQRADQRAPHLNKQTRVLQTPFAGRKSENYKCLLQNALPVITHTGVRARAGPRLCCGSQTSCSIVRCGASRAESHAAAINLLLHTLSALLRYRCRFLVQLITEQGGGGGNRSAFSFRKIFLF